MPRFYSLLLIALFFQQNCYLLNRGAREFNVIFFLGVMMVIIAGRIFMKFTGSDHERPPWQRFSIGLLVALLAFLG